MAGLAARAGAEDFRVVLAHHTAAFRTGEARVRCREVVFRADVSADHVMDDRMEREARGAARGTGRLIGIDLHSASRSRRDLISEA